MIRAAGLTVTLPLPRRPVSGRRRGRPPRRARRQPPRRRRGRRHRRALPGADRGRPAEGLEGPRRRARSRSATGIAALLPLCARRRRAARDRAAASDVCRRPRLREHARARQRPLRRARRRASASRSTSITSGGTRTCRARSRAPASASSPITSATGWCRPGTCCSTAACRATASSICSAIRAMVEATGYDGLIDVEIFSAQNWWKREPAEVLRICLERHQTVV